MPRYIQNACRVHKEVLRTGTMHPFIELGQQRRTRAKANFLKGCKIIRVFFQGAVRASVFGPFVKELAQDLVKGLKISYHKMW